AEDGIRDFHVTGVQTCALPILYGLHEALRLLAAEGLERAWARHQRHHEALKAGLDTLGLQFVVAEGARLPQMNAVWVPEGVDDQIGRASCRQRGRSA